MSGDSSTVIPVSTSRRGRFSGWLIFLGGVILGVFIGILIPLGIAYYYGPRSSGGAFDPLTGRHKFEETWLGLTIRSDIKENFISVWADQHGLPKLAPGSAGWVGVSSTDNEWFSPVVIACRGRGADVLQAIIDGRIQMEGQSAEETFRQYQGEYIAAYREHGMGWPVLKSWQARIKVADQGRRGPQ